MGSLIFIMVNARSRNKEGPLWLLILIAFLGLIGLLASCGEGRPRPEEPQAPLAAALMLAPADSMHLYDSILQLRRAHFDKEFSLPGDQPIAHTRQELSWDLLSQWVTVLKGERAVRFEYGLRDSSFVLGLVRMQLLATATPGLYSYLLPDSVYELKSGALVPYNGTAWRAARQYAQGDSTTYFARVQREDAQDIPKPLTYGTDAQAEVMPWDLELHAMYEANKAGHGDSTFHAVFTCISQQDTANVHQHRIAVHLRLRPAKGTGYRDLLNNTIVPNKPFLMHGADFGNLNPPGNGYYQLVPQ